MHISPLVLTSGSQAFSYSHCSFCDWWLPVLLPNYVILFCCWQTFKNRSIENGVTLLLFLIVKLFPRESPVTTVPIIKGEIWIFTQGLEDMDSCLLEYKIYCEYSHGIRNGSCCSEKTVKIQEDWIKPLNASHAILTNSYQAMTGPYPWHVIAWILLNNVIWELSSW